MKVTVVSPFYNEELIIEKAVRGMVASLERSEFEWEFITVDDGSTDGGLERLRSAVADDPRVRVLSYPMNRGRGYALRTGIDAATGDFIATTEIDLSWGEDIIQRMVQRLVEDPRIDAVIASPNMEGGGYRNVDRSRVWLSKVGNRVLRLFFSNKITMYTGMTRAYRREAICALKTFERGKEFHLEVVLKLHMLEARIEEVPAILEWRQNKLARQPGEERKSSFQPGKLIKSHLRFAIFANPIRYFWALSALCLVATLSLETWAIYRMMTDQVAAYLALLGVMTGLFSLLFFAFGIVTSQNLSIMKEHWRDPPPRDPERVR